MDNIQPGQMLGPYRIINQVGKGGMANVYKAYQPSVDRYVAIKVLPSQLAESKEFATRFHQEARIIAMLEHPHILPVFDYGESDGVAYFVMRYLDAGTLRDRMEAGRPLPLNEVDRIFTQLAEALSYAHARGVVHRDLKPANALIDSYGNIFLTDFGIAKLLESASPRLTQTDAIMGTPAYISPEQAQGNPVDQRSDIYSLGIILYEMVTGRVPFIADTPLAVLFKHISDPLPPPSSIKSDIPEPLEQVILKALAKDPQDRFATASDFVAAWKHALEQMHAPRPAPEPAPPTIVHPEPPPPIKPADAKPIAPKATPQKSSTPVGWIVGCLVGACVLFAIAGLGVLALNRNNMPFLNSATNTPLPTNTATLAPATDTAVPVPTQTAVPVSSDNALLRDDFSSSQEDWGTLDTQSSSVKYENDSLHMRLFVKNYVIWSRPNDEDYSNIHAEATVINNHTDSATAFGIVCFQQSEDWSFYYLAMTPAGEYAIIRATDGKDDVYLTNNGNWASSDLINQNADSYRVGADCGGGILNLYVDGQRVASATDSAYSTGHIGLFTWSGKNAPTADVSFDDFLLTSLK